MTSGDDAHICAHHDPVADYNDACVQDGHAKKLVLVPGNAILSHGIYLLPINKGIFSN